MASFVSCHMAGAYAGLVANDSSIAVSGLRVENCAYGLVIGGTSSASVESSAISSCSVGMLLCRCGVYGSVDVSRNRVEQCSECACLLDEVSGQVSSGAQRKTGGGDRTSAGVEAASPGVSPGVSPGEAPDEAPDEAPGRNSVGDAGSPDDGSRGRQALETARVLAAQRRGTAPLLGSLLGEPSPAYANRRRPGGELRVFRNYFMSGEAASLVIVSSETQLDPRTVAHNKLDTTASDALVMQGELAIRSSPAIFQSNNIIGSFSGKFGFVRHIYDRYQ